MKSTKEGCDESVKVNSEENACSTKPVNDINSVSLSSKDYTIPNPIPSIPVAEIITPPDKSFKSIPNMEVPKEALKTSDMEGNWVVPVVNSLAMRERESLPNLHKAKATSDKEEAAFTCSDCLFSNATEELGIDLGKIGDKKDLEGKYSLRSRGELRMAEKQEVEQSEGLEMRLKRSHTSYKMKETREEVSKKFFSFDWFADSLSKYSIGMISMQNNRIKIYT